MSLLTIIQNACAELGLEQPVAAISSTDLTIVKLVRLARKEGKDLAARCDWQILTKEGTFTTVAAETQVTDIAATFTDFDRYVRESMWNRTTGWPVQGPLDSLEWQQRLAAGTTAGMGNWFRFRGNSIIFYPQPTAGDSVYFEYISNAWCESASETEQSTWLADSDTGILDEEQMTLGVIWRFLKNNGLDYSEEYKTYEDGLAQLIGGEPKAVIDMTGTASNYLTLTIPEGNWNV